MTKGGTKKHLVYHYCSLESFMAIIQSKAIRLTDINKTNDYMEKKWIARYIYNTIDEQLEKNNVMMDLDEEYGYNDDTATHRAFLVDYVDELVCNADPILVACFSSNGDLLSQWRAYANDGKGVAIGFDEDLLMKLNGHKKKQHSIEYDDVEYDEGVQKREVQLAIKNAIQAELETYESTALGRLYESFDAYFRGEFEEFCEVLTRDMGFTSCFYKNPAFQEELESRIVYDPEIMIDIFDPNDAPFPCFENSRKKGKFSFSPVRYHIRDDKIVSHSDLAFEKLLKDGIIAEIVLGPKSQITETDMECFLCASGFHGVPVKLKRSTASYR